MTGRVKSKSGIRGVTYFAPTKQWRSKFRSQWISYRDTIEAAERDVLLAEQDFIDFRAKAIKFRLKQLAKSD